MNARPSHIEISNPRKILFPISRITKQEFVEYHQKIAEYMLPHLKDRPISMYRFPDGIGKKIFFQKNAPAYFPKWIKTKKIAHEKASTNYVICNDAETLLYLANQVITPHVWLSRIDKLEYPDRIIFDLDPQEGTGFADICKAARLLRKALDEINLLSFPMSTGSRGLHVVVPITREFTFKKASAFARVLASHVVDADPDKFTAEQRIAKRGSKVFIDTYRIGFAQTAVALYAVRDREGAPVAAPLAWNEVKPGFDPQQFTIRNIFARLKKKGDVWKGLFKIKQSLKDI
ncbi:ATP-dependent DNA ligase [Candidatus Woesearchaeota archaeon]|nr:ATP-dependent DNA ligase [Candidatus Woesearchaeota archaeon]